MHTDSGMYAGAAHLMSDGVAVVVALLLFLPLLLTSDLTRENILWDGVLVDVVFAKIIGEKDLLVGDSENGVMQAWTV